MRRVAAVILGAALAASCADKTGPTPYVESTAPLSVTAIVPAAQWPMHPVQIHGTGFQTGVRISFAVDRPG